MIEYHIQCKEDLEEMKKFLERVFEDRVQSTRMGELLVKLDYEHVI